MMWKAMVAANCIRDSSSAVMSIGQPSCWIGTGITSAQQVGAGHIDQLVSASIHDGTERPQPKPFHLLQLDPGWDRQLLGVGNNVEQRRAVMRKHLPNCECQVTWIFDPDR